MDFLSLTELSILTFQKQIFHVLLQAPETDGKAFLESFYLLWQLWKRWENEKSMSPSTIVWHGQFHLNLGKKRGKGPLRPIEPFEGILMHGNRYSPANCGRPQRKLEQKCGEISYSQFLSFSATILKLFEVIISCRACHHNSIVTNHCSSLHLVIT